MYLCDCAVCRDYFREPPVMCEMSSVASITYINRVLITRISNPLQNGIFNMICRDAIYATIDSGR